jgi:hypothetical protein
VLSIQSEALHRNKSMTTNSITASMTDRSTLLGYTFPSMPVGNDRVNQESGIHGLQNTYKKWTESIISVKRRAITALLLHYVILQPTRPLAIELSLEKYAEFRERYSKPKLSLTDGCAWKNVMNVSQINLPAAIQLRMLTRWLDAEAHDESGIDPATLFDWRYAKRDMGNTYMHAQLLALQRAFAMCICQLLIENGAARQGLRKKLEVLCFQMEAAGLWLNSACLVVRGICDCSASATWGVASESLNTDILYFDCENIDLTILQSRNQASEAISKRFFSRRTLVVEAKEMLIIPLPSTRTRFDATNLFSSAFPNFVTLEQTSKKHSQSNQSSQALLLIACSPLLDCLLQLWQALLPHKFRKGGADEPPLFEEPCDASSSERGCSGNRGSSSEGQKRKHSNDNEDGERDEGRRGRGDGSRRGNSGGGPPRSQRRPRIPRTRSEAERGYRCPKCAAGEDGILEVCWRINTKTVQYLKEVGLNADHCWPQSVRLYADTLQYHLREHHGFLMEDMHYKTEKGDTEDNRWIKTFKLVTTLNKGTPEESSWRQRHPGQPLPSPRR